MGLAVGSSGDLARQAWHHGPGRQFYQYVSVQKARVGVTFYADAYGNGGWTAVVLVLV